MGQGEVIPSSSWFKSQYLFSVYTPAVGLYNSPSVQSPRCCQRSDCCAGSGHRFRLDCEELVSLCVLCGPLWGRPGRKEIQTRVSGSTSNYLPGNSRSKCSTIQCIAAAEECLCFTPKVSFGSCFSMDICGPGQGSQSSHILTPFVWIWGMVILSTCLRDGWKFIKSCEIFGTKIWTNTMFLLFWSLLNLFRLTMLIFRWPLEMPLGPLVSLWLVSMPELVGKRFSPSMLHMF